jgi:predicted Zn-dependent protease
LAEAQEPLMSIWDEADCRAILQKVVALSKADECTATITGSKRGNIRFALNKVTTSGVVDDADLAVQVAFGRRTGTATINQFDAESLERVVRRAEELARLAPESDEFMPALEKQTFVSTPAFDDSIAAITPEYRAGVAASSIGPCRADQLVAAGFLTDDAVVSAFANSRGNTGYQKATGFDYTCTVRTEDGTGSGWVGSNVRTVSQFDADAAIRVAMAKAKRSSDARALEPGKYTVILEPAAAAGLLTNLAFAFDARQADEGRSFLAKKGGGTRLGEKIFDSRVSIHADPAHPDVPVLPWDSEGLARERLTFVERGTVSALQYSRYWAKEKKAKATAAPGNIVMAGGDKSLADLIKSARKAILVTRSYYIRMVDPQSLLLTGLTRDGTFYVEGGEIAYAVKNFRFNESPATMLGNIEELGRPVRVGDDESPFRMLIPPMTVRDFTFTSLSDAV